MKPLANPWMLDRLPAAAWPMHLDAIDRRHAAQAKMKRGGVLRKVGTLTADGLQITPAARPNAHECADPLPVAFLAFQRDFDPVARFCAVGTQ